MAFEPTLTTIESPSPRVRVDFGSLDADTATAVVYRSYGSVSSPVRAQSDFAVGGYTVTDYEVPLGITVSYSAEMFDDAGVSLGVTGSTSTVIYVDPGYAWFTNPFDPTYAAYVPLSTRFGVKKGPVRASQSYQIRTSTGARTVALVGDESLILDFDASCITESLEVADELRAVLSSGMVLIRTSPRLRLPPLLYLMITSGVVETGIGSLDDVEFGGERIEWPLSGFEATVPALSAGVYEGTWQDLIDNFATWQEVIDAYPTWLDILKNPPGV